MLRMLLALVLVAGCDSVQDRIIERAAGRALDPGRMDLLDDGKLHVVLCGTGTPIADAQRAGPCTAILAGGHFFLIDVGPGAMRQVALHHLPRGRLEALFLTHFHSDHIGEVGEAVVQSWIAGRTIPLLVYGPPGVEGIVLGFSAVYAKDALYRVNHHGADAMPPNGSRASARPIPLPAPDEPTVAFEADGLRVVAFAVDHEPVEPAYGYRIEYKGRSVVVSGDTRKSANLARHAEGADLLLHEGLSERIIMRVSTYAKEHDMPRVAKLTSDVVGYHTTPVQAAEIASAARVRVLAFTHVVPPLPNFVARRMFLAGVSKAFGGEVVIGTDGMHFELAPGSESVRIEKSL
jgi:ribonuclease Z